MKTKVEALKDLRNLLNGSCGAKCPNFEYTGDGKYCRIWYPSINQCFVLITEWKCSDCAAYFHMLPHEHGWDPCPCNRGIDPKELFLRLDEVIEELEKEDEL